MNQIAVATNKDGSLRICLDPRSLNRAVKREHYQIPVLEDILPDLAKEKVFRKVDLSYRYWHCSLKGESRMLTTLTTPFASYRLTRLPSRLSLRADIFLKRLHQALEGLMGVACVTDDVPVYDR